MSETIEQGFLDQGEFSTYKLNLLREKIEQRKSELTEIIRNYETLHENEDYDKVVEEIQEEQSILAYNIILTYLNKIEKSDDFRQNMLWAQKIIELDFAAKTEGYELFLNNVFLFVREVFKSNKYSLKNFPEGHAVNLFNPKTGEYYAQAELEEMHRAGEDLSLLEPHSDSPFYFSRDISRTNLKEAFFGKSPMFKGIRIDFPQNEAEFIKVKKSQTKPKIHVYHRIDGKKQKFKLKFGSELASEISAGVLSSALGFHHDMTKYVKNFRVKLPLGMSFKDFKKDWQEYYRKFDPNRYITSVATENDRVVITFREGILEAKPEELIRIGPWAWGNNGHRSLREVRGYHLFNMWIANNDVKESGNNKVVLRRVGDDYKFYQFVHDLGFSFGRFDKEKPKDFPWNLIKHYDDNIINFRYYGFQRNSGFKHVTYYDLKWMARKIAQLSKEQISDALEAGNWPTEVAILYREKLSHRRNQIVQAFNLVEEYGLLSVDQNISTENGVLNNGRLTQSRFDGYSQNFGAELPSVLQPLYENLNFYVAQGLIQATSAFDTIILDSRELGFDSDILAEVQFSLNREIRRNEMVNGTDDLFIVQDTLRVRFGLGVGVVLRGKVNYYKEYKLLYPVKTKREGTYHNKFIFNAMLPRTVRTGKLPDQYVLLMEDGFEGEGELLIDGQILPVSVGLSLAIGKLSRTIVSKKLDKFTIFQDASLYRGFYARLYAELLVLRIPIWQFSKQSGVLGRYQYEVELSTGDKSRKLDALDKLLQQGSMEGIDAFSVKSRIQTNYVLTRSDARFFFFENEYRRRVDTISQTIYENNEPIEVQNFYQVDVDRHSEWTFFGNGETKDRRYRLFGKVDDDGSMDDFLLDTELFIEDVNATSQEFSNAYLPMFNQLSMQKNFFNFTPQMHSINNIWHKLQVKIKLSYDQAALDLLIETPDSEYYELMAKYSNRDAKFWASRRDNNKIDSNSRFIRNKFHHWMRALKKARKARTDQDKYRIITDAFSNLVWKLSDGYQGLLLGRIHAILGRGNYFMEGLVTQAIDVENTMPAGRPLYNVMNPSLRKRFNMFEFDYRELEEIWELFQK